MFRPAFCAAAAKYLHGMNDNMGVGLRVAANQARAMRRALQAIDHIYHGHECSNRQKQQTSTESITLQILSTFITDIRSTQSQHQQQQSQ